MAFQFQALLLPVLGDEQGCRVLLMGLKVRAELHFCAWETKSFHP